MILRFPFPPTVNTYWRWTVKGPLISKRGRHYADLVKQEWYMTLNTNPQHQGIWQTVRTPVGVAVTLNPPDARKRDLDNYLKALFDAMTKAGIWEDDSVVQRMLVEWGDLDGELPPGRVQVTIGELI